MTLVVRINSLPPTPNQLSGMHWAKVAKIKKQFRTMAYFEARRIVLLSNKKALKSVLLELVRGSSRVTDIDNAIAAFKPVIDGIVDSGLILDDSSNFVKEIKYSWVKTKRNEAFVSVTIHEI